MPDGVAIKPKIRKGGKGSKKQAESSVSQTNPRYSYQEAETSGLSEEDVKPVKTARQRAISANDHVAVTPAKVSGSRRLDR